MKKAMKSHPFCCCCLSEACHKDLRSEYYFNGQKEVYYEMLLKTFDIKVEESCKICEECVEQLRNAAAFKRRVLQVEEAITRQLPDNKNCSQTQCKDDCFLDYITGEYESDSDEKISNDHDQLQGDEYDEDEDSKSFVIKLEAKEYANTSQDETQKTIENVTDSRIESPELYETADVSNTNDDFVLNDDIVDTDDNFCYQEKESILITQPNKKLKPNQSQIDKKENSLKLIKNSNLLLFDSLKTKYRCFYCKEAFLYIKELREHSLKHDEEKNINVCIRRLRGLSYKFVDISSLCCKLCDSNLENLNELQTHLTELHGIAFSNSKHYLIPYRLEIGNQCVICQEDFNTFYRLSIHMNSHYSNNVCEICGISFINRLSLRSHVNSIHKEKKCSKCSATFQNNYARIKHMRKVHNARSSVRYCLLCNKTFPYSYMLIEHRIQEHGAKRKISECGECGKTFLTAQNLKIHIRSVHMRERNHQCAVCGMGFFTRCDQMRHQRTHQDQRSFACDYCEGRFKSKDSLRRHLKRQHGQALTDNQTLAPQ